MTWVAENLPETFFFLLQWSENPALPVYGEDDVFPVCEGHRKNKDDPVPAGLEFLSDVTPCGRWRAVRRSAVLWAD